MHVKKILISVICLMLVVIIVIAINSKYQLMIVSSGSMEPTISTGSLIVVCKGNKVNKGDVITFNKGNSVVTHRIVDIIDEKIITKGDANHSNDPSFINQQSIIGTYLFAIPMMGYVFYFIQEHFMLCVLVVIGIYAIYVIIKDNH